MHRWILVGLLVVALFLIVTANNFEACYLLFPENGACTEDIQRMCNPVTGEVKLVSSNCSCTDTRLHPDKFDLIEQGWVSCPV